jgi:hypothetical protein
MVLRRWTVGPPFGIVQRVSGEASLLTRALKAVKADAACSILTCTVLETVNAFGKPCPAQSPAESKARFKEVPREETGTEFAR